MSSKLHISPKCKTGEGWATLINMGWDCEFYIYLLVQQIFISCYNMHALLCCASPKFSFQEMHQSCMCYGYWLLIAHSSPSPENWPQLMGPTSPIND